MGKTVIKAERTLLWTNPSPNSDYSGSKIYADFGSFKTIEILYRPNLTGTTNALNSVYFSYDTEGQDGYIFSAAGTTIYRAFHIYSTYIEFTNGYYYSSYGGVGPTVNDRTLIPYQIYGIK